MSRTNPRNPLTIAKLTAPGLSVPHVIDSPIRGIQGTLSLSGTATFNLWGSAEETANTDEMLLLNDLPISIPNATYQTYAANSRTEGFGNDVPWAFIVVELLTITGGGELKVVCSR